MRGLGQRLSSCFPETKKDQGQEGAAAGLARITALIHETLGEAGIDVSQIAGIGVGCPGPIEWEKGIVSVAVNLGWKNVAIGDYLEKEFNCPVKVLNDVDAGVYGEYRFGAGIGSHCVVGIFREPGSEEAVFTKVKSFEAAG